MKKDRKPVLNREAIGYRIAEEVQRSGMSLEQIAKTLRVKPDTVRSWLSGKHLPSIRKFVILVYLLDCQLDDLLIAYK